MAWFTAPVLVALMIPVPPTPEPPFPVLPVLPSRTRGRAPVEEKEPTRARSWPCKSPLILVFAYWLKVQYMNKGLRQCARSRHPGCQLLAASRRS